MANAPNAPIPATAPPAGVPESPQGMPFSLPPEMTPEMAQGRLAELKSDTDWQTRWLAGDERASTEFDQLTRRAVNQPQPAPPPVPDQNAEALKALGPPAKPEDYKIDVRDPVTGWPVRMDETVKTLVNGTLLPAAHSLGLSQSDLNMVSDYVMKPATYEACESVLHRMWGSEFAARAADFAAAVTPAQVELMEAYPDQLGSNPALIDAIVSAFRRRQLRR